MGNIFSAGSERNKKELLNPKRVAVSYGEHPNSELLAGCCVYDMLE